MIVTVTTNPSIDRTVGIEALKVGSVNRVQMLSVDPGGKGVNVSRTLASYGAETYAILICGSFGSRWFAEHLSELGIQHHILLIDGVTRCNITVVEESTGLVTKINEPGFSLTESILDELKATLNSRDLTNNWIVFAGRLNPGAGANAYRELVEYAQHRGARVAVDASGDELREVARFAKPELIKPNQHELAELVGRELKTMEAIIDAGHEVITWGVRMVLCSLGADGALLITDSVTTHAEPVHPVVGVPVGAGDILLATFLAGGATASALEQAIAWSAASVPLEGTAIPTPDQASAVKVRTTTSLDKNRTLVEVN